VSDQGAAYLAFVEGELRAERERRATFDARGQGLITTSGVLVTLLGGLAAVVRGGTAVRPGPIAVVIVVLALTLFVMAAICGIVAGWNRRYAVTTYGTITTMLGAHWTDTEVDARNNIATVHAKTINTLRAANKFKAACVSAGLILQVLALTTFASGVVVLLGQTG
jgi:hypothetical protein